MKSFILLLISCSLLTAQQKTAKEIIELSCDYHDPDNALFNGAFIFHFEESRPDGTSRKSRAYLAPSQSKFKIQRTVKEKNVDYIIENNSVTILLEGEADYTEEEAQSYRLDDSRAILMKDYYLYLWHLPMKLKDPGTIIHDLVNKKVFDDQELLEIKVTYEKEVGEDIWYFYFNTQSYALSGYRFYHDESVNDGEYILIEDEVKFGNIKIPKIRKWITHKEDKYLGTDTLVKIQKWEW